MKNKSSRFKNVHVVDHPLVQHKLSLIRNQVTPCKDFRDLLDEISMLMAFEVTRDIPTEVVPIKTPIATTKGRIIYGKKLAVVAILRAGLGMVEGILRLLPTAKVGHIGIYRDQRTLKAVQYYEKLPGDINERCVLLADPMLATGHSAIKALGTLKRAGVKNIIFMCLIAAPEGIREVQSIYPGVKIFTASIDDELDNHGYIVPGLGDAGDRLYGSK